MEAINSATRMYLTQQTIGCSLAYFLWHHLLLFALHQGISCQL